MQISRNGLQAAPKACSYSLPSCCSPTEAENIILKTCSCTKSDGGSKRVNQLFCNSQGLPCFNLEPNSWNVWATVNERVAACKTSHWLMGGGGEIRCRVPQTQRKPPIAGSSSCKCQICLIAALRPVSVPLSWTTSQQHSP